MRPRPKPLIPLIPANAGTQAGDVEEARLLEGGCAPQASLFLTTNLTNNTNGPLHAGIVLDRS
jgi:hypothetical protein